MFPIWLKNHQLTIFVLNFISVEFLMFLCSWVVNTSICVLFSVIYIVCETTNNFWNVVNCHNSELLEKIFSVIISNVYLFSFLLLRDGQSRIKVGYVCYSTVLIQNGTHTLFYPLLVRIDTAVCCHRKT